MGSCIWSCISLSQTSRPCCRRWCWTSRWSEQGHWPPLLGGTVGGRTPGRPRQTPCARRTAQSGLSVAQQRDELGGTFRSIYCWSVKFNMPLLYKSSITAFEGNSHNVPGGLGIVGSKVLDVWREALVQPQVIPPLHSHQVAKPLQKTRHRKFKERKGLHLGQHYQPGPKNIPNHWLSHQLLCQVYK